jgi:putative transposase
MPSGLKRYYGGGDFHFITCCCYHRQPWLNSPQRRDLFVSLLEQARRRYRFVVVGYVVMPEHFHLLISEPEEGDPSKVMQIVKQRFAQRVLRSKRKSPVGQSSIEPPSKHVWQARFYDFNVWSERKRMEKLCYMHCNPVKRGLVTQPEQWPWSSSQDYSYGQTGTVQVIDSSVMKMRKRGTAA